LRAIGLGRPRDLHTLALTSRMLFEEAEKRRWNTLSIEQDPRPDGKSLKATLDVVFQVEGRTAGARVVNLRIGASHIATPKQTWSFITFVERFFKVARGL
jgi:hypothetical protein